MNGVLFLFWVVVDILILDIGLYINGGDIKNDVFYSFFWNGISWSNV